MLFRFLVLKLNSNLVTIIKLMNLLIQYHHWYFVMISNHFLKQWAQYKKNLNWKLTVIKCYTYGQPIKHNTEKAWKFQMDFAFHKKDLKYDQMLTIDNWFTVHLKVVCKTASSWKVWLHIQFGTNYLTYFSEKTVKEKSFQKIFRNRISQLNFSVVSKLALNCPMLNTHTSEHDCRWRALFRVDSFDWLSPLINLLINIF